MRLAQAAAAKSIADVIVEPVDNPLQALADLAAQATAWKDHMADTVAQLNDQFRFTDDKGAEHLDARVALLERAMDRCQKYLVDWVRLGFEERRVSMDEAQAEIAAGWLRMLGELLVGRLVEVGVDGAVVVGVQEALPALCREAIETSTRGDRQ